MPFVKIARYTLNIASLAHSEEPSEHKRWRFGELGLVRVEMILPISVVSIVVHVSSKLHVRVTKDFVEAQLIKKLDCTVEDAAE